MTADCIIRSCLEESGLVDPGLGLAGRRAVTLLYRGKDLMSVMGRAQLADDYIHAVERGGERQHTLQICAFKRF